MHLHHLNISISTTSEDGTANKVPHRIGPLEVQNGTYLSLAGSHTSHMPSKNVERAGEAVVIPCVSCVELEYAVTFYPDLQSSICLGRLDCSSPPDVSPSNQPPVLVNTPTESHLLILFGAHRGGELQLG